MFEKISFSLAALEVIYPNIPGYITPSSTCTGNDCLGIFIAYWFGFAIYIAGAIALISLAVASVQFIVSAGNTGATTDAKDRIRGALLGMVLLFSSFIIIRAINPALITPSLTPLPGVAGVFYTNMTERKPVGLSVADVSQEQTVKDGYTKLIYVCSKSDIAPALLLWVYNAKNFDYINAPAKVIRLKCEDPPFDISGFGSFQMAFETPGVYFCMSQCPGGGNIVCDGYMSWPLISNINLTQEPFNYTAGDLNNISSVIKSAIIVNSANSHYGIIFHGTGDLKNGGECTAPIDENGCNNVNIPFSVNAADIFNINNNAVSSGRGVEFYEGENGWDTGKQFGVFNATPQRIGSAFWEKADKLLYDYANVDSLEAAICMSEDPQYPACSSEEAEDYDWCCNCSSFKDCPGSIHILGKYLVALYSKIPLDNKSDTDNFKWYCRTFYKDVPTLKAEQYANPGQEVFTVGIAPIK